MATQRKSVQKHKENLFIKETIFTSTCKGGNMLTVSKFKILNMLKILHQQLKLPTLILEVQNYSPFRKTTFLVIK